MSLMHFVFVVAVATLSHDENGDGESLELIL
jgi:hypothetical protein